MLKVEAEGLRKRFRRGSAGWAVTYHVSMFGAVVLSALAALLIKLSEMDNLAAALATSAAVLTALSSVGDFQRKWHANRDAFYALDELLLKALDPQDLTDKQFKEFLVEILRTQHNSWAKASESKSSP